MFLHPEGIVNRLLECFKMLGPFFCLGRVLSKDFEACSITLNATAYSILVLQDLDSMMSEK